MREMLPMISANISTCKTNSSKLDREDFGDGSALTGSKLTPKAKRYPGVLHQCISQRMRGFHGCYRSSWSQAMCLKYSRDSPGNQPLV